MFINAMNKWIWDQIDIHSFDEILTDIGIISMMDVILFQIMQSFINIVTSLLWFSRLQQPHPLCVLKVYDAEYRKLHPETDESDIEVGSLVKVQ